MCIRALILLKDQREKFHTSYFLNEPWNLSSPMPFFAKPTTQQIKWESQRPPVPPVCICNFGQFNTWEELEGVWICVWPFLQTEVFTLIALIALKPLGAQMWNIGKIFFLATQIQHPNIYLCTDIALLRKGGGKDGRPWICANKIKSIKVFFLDFEPINSFNHRVAQPSDWLNPCVILIRESSQCYKKIIICVFLHLKCA